MAKHAHRIGAVFYLLWGLLHVVGGAALLLVASESGAGAMLAMIDNGVASGGLHPVPRGVADGLASFHAWNLLWLGLLVAVVAVIYNWRNDQAGYWLNLAVVVAADFGLLVFFVAPGYMPATDAMPGPLLAILAICFATVGLLSPSAGVSHASHDANKTNQVVPS